MNSTHSILLTGITGSLGSVLAKLISEDGHRVKAVVRGRSQQEAAARAKQILSIIEAKYDEKHFEVIAGDVCKKNLGLSVNTLSDISLIIHCAALLDFSDDSAKKNHLINVIGTDNVLDLAETLNVPVCHVSTAYAAGKRRGIVREDELDTGQEFHNSYEASKCLAEKHVQDWSEKTGLPVMIFRPSILVGDSQTGKIINFDGLYNLMRFFDNVCDLIRKEEFRVVANPQATKNFIPVDIASDMIWKIIKNGKPGVYHITNPKPVSLADLREIFIELFDVPQARFVDVDDFGRKKATRYELMYKKTASLYQPYLCEEPIFDRTSTGKVLSESEPGIPEMNLEFFRRLLAYARKGKWGKVRNESTRQSTWQHIDIVEDYFNHFLTNKMHRQLLPDLRNLSANCRIKVSEIPSKSWFLQIENGRLEKISQNGMMSQCTFLTDGDTFEKIIRGVLAPQQAFFRKKIEIQGSIETGLKLATVLAAFFKKYPYSSGGNYG